MAIEAEKLIATFEARFSSIDKALAKVRGDSNKTFDGMVAGGKKAEAALANIGSRGTPGLDKLNRSLNQTKGNTANVAAQFQDMAVQLHGGTSPFTVALQQVNQLTAALGTGGAGAALKTIGAGFLSLLSPVNLVGIALVAGAGYAYQYFTAVEDGTEKSNKALEEQEAIIRRVAERWGDAIPPLKEYVETLDEMKAIGERNAALESVIDRQLDPARKLFAGLTQDRGELISILAGAGAPFKLIERITQDIDTLDEKLKDNTATYEDARRVYNNLLKAFQRTGEEGLGQAANEFKRLASEIGAATRRMDEFQQAAIRALTLGGGSGGPRRYSHGGRPTIDLPGTAPAPGLLGVDDAGVFGGFRGTSKDYLRTRAVNDRIRGRIEALDDAFADGLARFLVENPSLKIISAVRTTAEQAALYNDPRVGRAARPGRSLHESGFAVDLSDSNAAQRARARAFGIEFPFPVDDRGHVQMVGARAGRSGRGAGMGLNIDPLAGFHDDPWRGLRELGGLTEHQIMLNKQLQESYGMVAEAGMNALHGIINALEDGKITTQEWLQIALTLIEQLSQIPAVGGKGGGGGVFGFLGQLLGGIFHDGGVVGAGGRKRAVPALAFAGAPRMHGGGIAGLRNDEVPAILQRGEIVTPRGGRGAGGMHVTVGLRKDGFSIYPEIVEVSRSTVRKAAPQIVGQARKAGRADFGANAADWQMRDR